MLTELLVRNEVYPWTVQKANKNNGRPMTKKINTKC